LAPDRLVAADVERAYRDLITNDALAADTARV
jgi:hypothetical protein